MSAMDGDVTTITDEQINFAGVLSLACTIPGTCVCFIVLVAYGVAACYPNARKTLDRVSFRLLLYTLIFNVLFGIAYALTPSSPTRGCDIGAFAVNTRTGTWSEWQKDGKILFGWDNNTKPFSQHSNYGVTSIWSNSRLVRTMLPPSERDRSEMNQCQNLDRNATSVVKFTQSRAIIRDPKYRKVILRIVMYPIISLLMNYSTVVLDLNTTIKGLHTRLGDVQSILLLEDFNLLVLDLILYGMRTLAYGLLAAADPSFISAVRKIRGLEDKRSTTRERISSIYFNSWRPAEASATTRNETDRHVNLELQESPQANNKERDLACDEEVRMIEHRHDPHAGLGSEEDIRRELERQL
ncbi:hypothetical protein BDQ12DRAFT_713730 [Crucibulum laeve]|uniref:Uncharacterized protein n=1 Tax=Crucibulum laeve TaxID=68775 RepID=A0A5C3LV96_9AGAR|nr:hypothetical protein BDQ12DRAFT_713730 [Crucibulum laeve]